VPFKEYLQEIMAREPKNLATGKIPFQLGSGGELETVEDLF
jgi:hypothetical protein